MILKIGFELVDKLISHMSFRVAFIRLVSANWFLLSYFLETTARQYT